VREAALPPAQRILGSSPVQRRPEVAVDLGDTARVDGEVGHRGLRLAITVPASWLTRVWLRGLDVMPDGGFGVETHGSPPDAMSIARWEAGPERSWTLRVATEPMRVNTYHEIT
jgi:hypothetical protein